MTAAQHHARKTLREWLHIDSISFRISLAFLGLILPLTLLLLGMSWWYSHHAIESQATATHQARCELAVLSVRDAYHRTLSVVNLVQHAPRAPLVQRNPSAEPSSTHAALEQLLTAKHAALPPGAQLWITDHDGNVLYSSATSSAGIQLAALAQRSIAHGSAQAERQSQQTLIAQPVQPSATAQGCVIVALPDAAVLSTAPWSSLSATATRDAQRLLDMPEPMRNVPLYIATRLDNSAVLNELNDIMRLHIGTGMALIVLSVIGALLIGRFVTKPIRTISVFTSEVARTGDLSSRVPSAGSREVDELSTSIQHMMDELARSRSELEQRVVSAVSDMESARGQLNAVLDSIDDAVWSLSPDGATIRYLSPAAARIIGAPIEQLRSDPTAWLDRIHSDDLGLVLSARAALIGGSPMDIEYRICISKDGGERWVRDHGRAIADAHGIIVRLDGVVSDISGRMAMQLVLQEREIEARHLAMVASRTDNAVVMTDDAGKITWVNKAFERITGYAMSEVIARKPGDFLQGPGTDQSVVAAIRAAVRSGAAFTHELLNYTKDGRPYWVMIEAQPLSDDSGGASGYMAIERDITAQREVEAELRRARDAAEAAVRAKAAFLATMSHEIRTPLNGIIGMTDQLLTNDLSNDLRSDLAVVRDSGQVLLTLVNDILDFSKIEAGRMELAMATCDARTIAGEVLSLFRPQAQARGLVLTLECPAAPPLMHADPLRLRQIITNLVGNAVKFTEHGGVTVRIVREASSTSTAHGDAVISITDTGIGIPADRLHRLFQEFSQVDAGVARKFGGSGLGLAICKRLSELMGGQITVSSVAGNGSTFSVRFPALAAEASDDRRASQSPTLDSHALPRVGLRILIAEDNPVNQRVVSAMLKGFSAQITMTADGALAEAAFNADTFDLVLMDMHMPNVDGLEATRRIRDLEQTQQRTRVPIIALTANAFAEDRAMCLNVGMDDLLPKPITRGSLAAMLVKWS